MEQQSSTPKIEPPKARPEWTNPALQAMGIRRLRLPSRNWTIFWAMTGSIVGLYMYDRRQRKQARQYWKDQVSYLAEQTMKPSELPRKVTVYVAPPPADFLDLGLAHFRQYIKPILTAAAVDYELRSESRQGEIRNTVAEEIRNYRKKQLGIPTSEVDENGLSKDEQEIEQEIKEKLQQHLIKDETGGVICVGRGAYKEYMNGLQEGWLGPLDPPEPVQTETEMSVVGGDNLSGDNNASGDSNETVRTIQEVSINEIPVQIEEKEIPVDSLEDSIDTKSEEPIIREEKRTDELADEDGSEKKAKPPVPKPYILPDQYTMAQLPSEFDNAHLEPFAALSFPHLLGFLTIPIRIYRFFNRRLLADKMGEATAAVVFAHTRSFTKDDIDALVEEEDEWPKKWKQRGIENNSEWIQDLVVDDRIAERLQVYEMPDNVNNSYE